MSTQRRCCAGAAKNNYPNAAGVSVKSTTARCCFGPSSIERAKAGRRSPCFLPDTRLFPACSTPASIYLLRSLPDPGVLAGPAADTCQNRVLTDLHQQWISIRTDGGSTVEGCRTVLPYETPGLRFLRKHGHLKLSVEALMLERTHGDTCGGQLTAACPGTSSVLDMLRNARSRARSALRCENGPQ
jgi:hypothetical protein